MRKILHSINSRILLIPIIALMALIVAGLVSIRTIANVTLEEHQARARAVTDAATKIVEFYEGKAARGEMPKEAAQTAAREALRAVRYDGTEHVIARRLDGDIVVNGLFSEREGTPSFDNNDANGTFFSRDMIRAAEAGGGFTAIQGIGGIVARMNEITADKAAAAEERENTGRIQQDAFGI